MGSCCVKFLTEMQRTGILNSAIRFGVRMDHIHILLLHDAVISALSKKSDDAGPPEGLKARRASSARQPPHDIASGGASVPSLF
jgi:hypothetical protein